MPKFAREERRAIVLQIQTLLTSGIPSTQVVEQVMREHGVHRVTANRYLNLAYADWNRSRNRTRKSKASFAVAVRERAMRLALTKKKFLVVDGQLLERDDPDVKAYLDAADSAAKIEGLFAPERIEIINESFAQLWRELVLVLRDNIRDLPLLSQVVNALRAKFEGSNRAVLSTLEDKKRMGLPDVVEGDAVVQEPKK